MVTAKRQDERSFQLLRNQIEGEVYTDKTHLVIYATDASVYREQPIAVVIPKHTEDVKMTIEFAKAHHLPIIPRATGTSLAGQCVGKGIVVDISKHLTNVIKLNVEEQWVSVEPGVIRDELNRYLQLHGLFFGPNTSTANRATIGGMVGNNSCGSTSIAYGTTRDHILELEVILSNGEKVVFGEIDRETLSQKTKLENLEGQIYRQLVKELANPVIQHQIKEGFPKASVTRRNTGYAVDELLSYTEFGGNQKTINVAKLLAGSEGTLAFTTEIKLSLDPLPAPGEVLLCAHFNSVDDSLKAVLMAMEHQPAACELMDKIILDCTKANIEQEKNRFFVEGDPAAILMIELRGKDNEIAKNKAQLIIDQLKENDLGYAFPMLFPPHTNKAWSLRKAGLGLLANIPGDAKAVACIEDTAVDVVDLPAYIEEFTVMMESFNQRAVYYAHAGAGELHLRPILDLKKSKDVALFRQITESTTRLVKKFRGSLSGEHGDGRVRAEFIPLIVGEENYQLFRKIKKVWDPNTIFNPGKIVDAPPMDESLRYVPDREEPDIQSIFNFDEDGGILRAAEKCNGSGDCRKLHTAGGTMCPSYQATRDEKDSTRARANALRELLTRSAKDENPYNHPELKAVMDLCISCKGCTAECPSNVDMSTLKAEFLYQYYKVNGVPLRARLFAANGRLNKLAAKVPGLSRFFLGNKITGNILKKMMGVAPQRSLPLVQKRTLGNWYKKNYQAPEKNKRKGSCYFFFDEFTDLLDSDIGIKAIQLLNRLGYEVQRIGHDESGRAHLSKGLLKEAQKIARKNVSLFKPIISEQSPLIGVEPSAILGFRDEYPRLVEPTEKKNAEQLAQHCLTIEEFISREINNGNISSDDFHTDQKHLLLHGHCHQKALSSINHTVQTLSLPANYHVEVIPSGCCGMAGSFGYEKEHYEVSMKIGELVLFPAIRKADVATTVVAPGTSCRHQIQDGTQRKALHPVDVLWAALE